MELCLSERVPASMTDMGEVLLAALACAYARGRFAAREVFSRRVGKQTVVTVGIGSALSKGVRKGYLKAVREGTRRRSRTYARRPRGVLDRHRGTTHEFRARHTASRAVLVVAADPAVGPRDVRPMMGWMNLSFGAFTLFLPALPMDVGRILCGLVPRKVGHAHGGHDRPRIRIRPRHPRSLHGGTCSLSSSPSSSFSGPTRKSERP